MSESSQTPRRISYTEPFADLLAAIDSRVSSERAAEVMLAFRAEAFREAADIADGLRQFEPATGARKSAQVSENVGILRVSDELRRRADVSGGAA